MMNFIKFVLLGIFLWVFFTDISNIGQVYRDGTILFEIILGIILIVLYKKKSKTTFLFSFGMCFIYLFTLFFDRTSLVVERMSVWIYVSLVFGVIQQFIELKHE